MMVAFELSKSSSKSSRRGKPMAKKELLDEVLRFMIKDDLSIVKVRSPHLKRLLQGNLIAI